MTRNTFFTGVAAVAAAIMMPAVASAQTSSASAAQSAPDAKALAAYAGTYKLAPFDVVVTAEGDKLFAEPSGQPKLELTPMGQDNFSIPAVNAGLTFTRNTDGIVKSLTLQMRGKSIAGEKAN